ncbi:MAG: ABC transporter ATP-binding protein [Actinomycetia bacterium]|nr:ABC transporter ATP-binding protein [Actinomycetes bacterium]
MDVLRIHKLAKSFGEAPVLRDVSLAVPEGSVFGFIGANGAGKTTTMKIVLGLLKADRGEVSICDEQVRFGMTPTNRHVGYLPDVPEFYSYLRPREYLRLCGQIVGLESATIASRSTELLELVGLKGVTKKIGGFSRGMKQRLGVAQALINEPRLLICDEPTSALDPLGRKETLDLLRQISSKTTVVFSTHVLSDVERICDRAAVLNGGTIVLEGTLAELKERHQADGLQIEFASAADLERFCARAPEALLAGCERTATELTLHVQDLAAAQRACLRILTESDLLPLRLELLEPSIENLFLEAVA